MDCVRRRYSAALAVMAACSPALALPPADLGTRWFSGSYEQALEAARKEKKLLLFDAWAKWCAYCKLMDREVWNLPEVARQLEPEVVPFKAEVDNRSGVGMDLGKRLEIGPLPCTLVIDPLSGKILERLEGTQGAKEILEAIDRARVKRDPGQAVASAADPAGLLRVAGQLLRTGNPGAAQDALWKAIQADSNCARDAADEAALLLADLLQTSDPGKALSAVHGVALACAAASRAGELWQRLATLARETQGETEVGQILKERAERFPEDPEALLEAARWEFERGKDLALPARLAEKVLLLSPEETRAMALLGELEARQGRFEKALEWVAKAIKIDPHSAELRELRLKLTLAAGRAK